MVTWQERAERVLLDGCSTFSKRVQSYIGGVYDSHVQFGYGNYLRMSDGTDLLDTVSGLGSNLLCCQNNYSLEPIEVVLAAEEILKKLTYHQKLKFVKNGGDATTAAVRYARAYTGKQQVYYTGYHGCQSLWVSCTPPALGCLYEHCTKFESMTLLLETLEGTPLGRPNVAAVVIEPLELDLCGLQDLLRRFRTACNRQGILLVFDEVITGWRVPKYTVANMCEVYPDISCLGKGLGGGYPLGIVAVTDEIASKTPGVFISHTFGAEQHTLIECLKILKLVTETDINLAWLKGDQFQKRVNDLLLPLGQGLLMGYPTRFVWTALSEHLKSMIWQGAYRRGVLLGAAFFPKLTWSDEVWDKIYDAIESGVTDYKLGVPLDGKPPQPVFRRN